MSCDECDRNEENGMIAYYRWGKATVGFIGCDEHLKEIFEVLNKYQEEK